MVSSFRARVKAQSAKLQGKRCVEEDLTIRGGILKDSEYGLRAVWTHSKSEATSKARLGEAGITLEMRAI